MTAAELDRLESELDLRLPEAYRGLMLAYPWPPSADVAAHELCNDVALLLDQNRNPARIEYGVDRPFVIGTDGAEEVYLIDLNAPASPVYVYEIETGKTKVHADDLEHWKAKVDTVHREIEADAAYLEQRRADKNKKWWEFWR